MVLNALDEILFWDNIELLKKIIHELLEKYYPHDYDSYSREKDIIFKKYIPDKAEFIRRLEKYSSKEAPFWISGRCQTCDDITNDGLSKALFNATKENGRIKVEKVMKRLNLNTTFWEMYAENILHTKTNRVLELTIGAGVGTTSVMRKMSKDDIYFGVDIDFLCAKNADAIAKYYNANGLGIATSLWNLPFDNEMFSTVCSNQGFEECREIPTILKEASRVLIPNGKVVLHCNIKAKNFWYKVFAKYGFSIEETEYWLKKVRLYSDTEQIKELATDVGLNFTKEATGDTGYILVFKKM